MYIKSKQEKQQRVPIQPIKHARAHALKHTDTKKESGYYYFFPFTSLPRPHGLPAVDDDLLVDAVLDVAVLESLPRLDAGLVDVDLEEAQAAVVAPVAGVAAEADAAAVAHPEGRVVVLEGEGAVVVAVVAGEGGGARSVKREWGRRGHGRLTVLH